MQCQHHSCPCRVGPSILTTDLAALGAEARACISAGADYLHLDVMDGHFVPNLSVGPMVIKSLRKSFEEEVFFDCHMMVSDPLRWVEPIRDAGGSQYTFHFEACTEADIPKVASAIRAAGMRVGIALKPSTSFCSVAPVISLVDQVLFMTVEPGFGGQSFMPNVMPKVLECRTAYPELDIGVDGGVGPETVEHCAKAGANSIVAGSAVYKVRDGKKIHNMALPILKIRKAVEDYGHGQRNKGSSEFRTRFHALEQRENGSYSFL